ncbi:ABC transporter ATP-binding protein [Chelatococcus sp. GCM10030263]|uniref:ABC transporter ATP-binding protein n=1 Tax=Chelatococcus sp. GCM10030263 TaxID=3273387 RepID=UPI00360F0CBB
MASSLSIRGLHAGYGAVRVLSGIDLDVATGETVALLGTNGNGKSTLIKCIAGQVKPTSGRIVAQVDGVEHDLCGLSTEAIVGLGIALVPEGRRLFPKLTVEENLLLGAYRPEARLKLTDSLAFCFDAFPRLKERRRQLAGSMSGGEQQMLAIARALMTLPKILLVDEPSVGLAPILVAKTIDTIAELKARLGLTVLMAEQNFPQAIRIANRGYVLVHGRIELKADDPQTLRDSEIVRRLYLGTA